MSAPTQLSLYNGALRLCKQTSLLALTDDVEARYKLDEAWGGSAGANGDDALNFCLEQGQWFFARRTAQYDFDPSFTAPFGYQYRFGKPDDWVRTTMVCSDPYMNVPITAYSDEQQSWFSDVTPIYVQYVSNDPEFGGNFDLWPQTFVRFFEAYLAQQVGPHLTNSEITTKEVMAAYTTRLKDALAKAAMNEATAFPPLGRWVRSRLGRHSLQDRGNAGTLIG